MLSQVSKSPKGASAGWRLADSLQDNVLIGVNNEFGVDWCKKAVERKAPQAGANMAGAIFVGILDFERGR